MINTHMDHITELDLKNPIDRKSIIGSYERTKIWLDKMDEASKAFDEAYRQYTATQHEIN